MATHKYSRYFSESIARETGRMKGFTLIELLVTVMILGILLSLAAPSLSALVRDQRVKTVTGDVYASLIFARSEAIKRNQFVVMCAGNSTNSGCGNTTDWSKGWIVFLDADDNGYPGAVSDILKKQDAFADISLTGIGGGVSFQRDGRVKTKNDLLSVPPPFVLSIAGSTAVAARCVSVDLSGRPNIKVDTDGVASNGCQ